MDNINKDKNPELTSKYSQYFVEKETGEVYSALELKKKVLKELQKIDLKITTIKETLNFSKKHNFKVTRFL